VIQSLNGALCAMHGLGLLHGDVSTRNIILQELFDENGKSKGYIHPVLIDYELAIPIDDTKRPFQGTARFSSLALTALEPNETHLYRERDDFESLFLVMIYWINRFATPFETHETKHHSLVKEGWPNLFQRLTQQKTFDLNASHEVQRMRDTLYQDYDETNPSEVKTLV